MKRGEEIWLRENIAIKKRCIFIIAFLKNK